MTPEWISALSELTNNGVPCVLATVIEAKGSTPREAGVKMVVTSGGQFGTIGGGDLEFQAVGEARKLLASFPENAVVRSYALGPALSQCCGGTVTVLLETFVSLNRTLLLFGAGHVGREVVKVLENLPIRVKWVDERASEFPADIPENCEKIVTAEPLSALEGVTGETYILVMTHSHDLDFEIVKGALGGEGFAYLGMIGSETKSARFRSRLLDAGIDEKNVARLVSPVGIGGVTGKRPREIAIAAAAELLSLGLAAG
ncbi:MAG: xanthine dehydrogenase accessory protein XdhC [Pseudomonadota bacterium]